MLAYNQNIYRGCIFILRAHNGAAILHPNTKVLDFQGLFVFLGVKKHPLSPLHLFPDLLDLNLRPFCHAERDKFPCSIGRHLVKNMI